MITILICVGVIAALLQPNAPRLFAACIFTGIILLHELVLSSYTGLQYYGSAALFDLAIIAITSGINPMPKMVISLHKICMLFIFANLAGWVLWFFYYPPLVYDAAMVLIYAWALVTLINRDGLNVGGYTLSSWASCFRFNRSPWAAYLTRNARAV